jgi:hypothetical protein
VDGECGVISTEHFWYFPIRKKKLDALVPGSTQLEALKTTSNRARNWQERGKKSRIIVRDRTRAEIEKSPEIGAFLVAAI